MGSEERSMEEELAFPILLADRVRNSVEEADSFKFECSEVGKKVDRLSHMLRSIVRLATSSSSSTQTSSLYERPIRRIVSEVSKNLERALTLIRKCKRSGILRRVVTITSATDFRKLFLLLDNSIGDMKWLLNVFEVVDSNGGTGGGIVLSLPPIASNDPILSWVWSFVAAIQTSSSIVDRIDAANQLASLAVDNDRNKKIIVEEGGVPPLLKLLKEGVSAESQVAASTALANLATDQERVRQIVAELGVPIIVQVLWDSPMLVQTSAANLVSRMAENDSDAQEEFARENAIRPLVSLLSCENPLLDEPKPSQSGKPTTLHSLVLVNKELGVNSHLYPKTLHQHNPHLNSSLHSEGSSRGGNHKKERESEKPEVKLQLKIKCAEALWFLSRGSVSNSQRITETKGLLCLAKYIEKEQGELQFNCLMTVMEIAGAAELNADLRRAAFKTNSLAAKAVVDQILRIIQEEDTPPMQIPAIKAIGSLARAFQARETRVLRPLVTRLDHRNLEVATEAVIALGKFACPENFLCVQHSKAIIEFGGVSPLLRLLRVSERAQLYGLILLCYLALHVGNSEALDQSKALSALEGASRAPMSQHLLLRELLPKAIYQLGLYHEGDHPHRQFYGS
ncbi:armadillo repeat only [Thalictrum thalictroides]|uniref:Armadillo repeat only n=1 Tax=Thalictrum thalictroides TaxID=46969 RepID=A0A7J6VIU5_THATH|nr:armadillo repeat only [Thalictrum thalictroides]